jgi:hypothetical protein
MRSLLVNIDVRVLDAEMRLYRACAGSAEGVALESFRSHFELKRPPRGPENRATVIHMALSMFEEPEPCWDLIERTRGKIGDQVAELHLTPGRGVCVAKTAGPLHWSVWARPEILHDALAALMAQ